MTRLALLFLAACSSAPFERDGSSTTDTSSDDWDSDSYADSDTDTDADTDRDVDTSDTGTDAEDTDTDTGDTGESACDDATNVVLFLSPDDSNSSPAQVRDAVLDGWTRLSSVPIRTWEFFNYYQFDYPRTDDAVTVTPSLARLDANRFVLQIGVASQTVAPDEREPLNIVLSIDTSGSMSSLMDTARRRQRDRVEPPRG